jgi:hypothetical protein
MSEAEIDPNSSDRQPQFSPDTFANVALLTAIAVDPRGTAKRLRQLERAQAAADAGRADLQQQSTSFRDYEATTRAELEAGAKVNTDKAVALHVAETNLQHRERNLASRELELSQANESLKLRFMLFAHVDQPGPLQDKPSWNMLAHELLQIEKDPHYMTEPRAEIETSPPDDLPAGSTLSRTTYRVRTRRPDRVSQGA